MGFIAPAVFNVTNTGEFANGKLVGLNFYIPLIGITYVEVIADMTEKLGKPSGTGIKTFQNGLGAKFDFPWASWRGGTVVADLTQNELKSVMLTISDAQWMSQQEKQRRPNSLD